jgi:hypothetical protein
MEAKPFTIAAGEEKNVDIELNNPSDAITAFQFDMNLPEGFSLVKDADGSYCKLAAERGMTTTHQMGSNVLPNGDLRVACFSTNNSTIAGTSGTVATLRIKADETVAAGTYYLTLHDAVLAHADGMNSITPAETKTAINVGATGITGTTNNGLQISTGKGTITVKATTTQTVQIVSTNGALIANRTVQAGETVTINATAGVYIVNGIKMIVK